MTTRAATPSRTLVVSTAALRIALCAANGLAWLLVAVLIGAGIWGQIGLTAIGVFACALVIAMVSE
jgi:hypothetical protein